MLLQCNPEFINNPSTCSLQRRHADEMTQTCLPEIKAINLDIFSPRTPFSRLFPSSEGLYKVYIFIWDSGSHFPSPKVREPFSGQWERSQELYSWPYWMGIVWGILEKLQKLKLHCQRQSMCLVWKPMCLLGYWKELRSGQCSQAGRIGRAAECFRKASQGRWW